MKLRSSSLSASRPEEPEIVGPEVEIMNFARTAMLHTAIATTAMVQTLFAATERIR